MNAMTTGSFRNGRRTGIRMGRRDIPTFGAYWLRYLFLLFLILMGLVALGADLRAQTSNYVTVSPGELLLDVPCGESICSTILVVNVGTVEIALLGGAEPDAPFELDVSGAPIDFPLPLGPGDTLELDYCYSPTAPGTSHSELLLLEFDTLAGALPAIDTVRLQGISRAPDLVITPATIDFGNVTIGQTSCRTVEVRNNGNTAIELSTMNVLTFPFSPELIPDVVLGPAEAISVEVCFSPIVPQDYSGELSIYNGACRSPAALEVEGRGLDRVANIGPVLQVIAPDFDTALCGTTKCRTLTFRNVGTDPLRITELDNLPAPFTGAIGPLPIVIPADDERTFTVCYQPGEAGSVDSAILNLTADNRVSLSIATLFDISGSMNINFGGTTRIAAANAAGRAFLGYMINDPARGVQDEGGVFVFGAVGDIAQLSGFSSNIPALQASIPASVTVGTPTCLYEGVIATVNSLVLRNQPGRRVMVVLADGANSCPGSSRGLAEAIAAARNAGIRIYTIGIGTADAGVLTSLASQTGGFYSEALTPSELLASYQQIANSLSRDQGNVIRIGGRSVAPEMALSSNAFSFGEVMVGEEECATLTVTNRGDAPLENVTVIQPGNGFRLFPTTLPRLLPGESTEVSLCFGPGTIRDLESELRLRYRACAEVEERVELDGYGYDSVTLALDAELTARPGSTVDLETRLLDNVPEHYRVDSLTLRFRYNKTMLYPADEEFPFLPTSGLITPMLGQQIDQLFGSDDALLEVTFVNGRLVNTSGPGVLGALRFLVLHGNALSTPIELVEASFADGNPRVGITGTARFDADSLCFQEDRLVDGTGVFGPVARLVSTSPGAARVSIEMPEEEFLHVALYDVRGALRSVLTEEFRSAGVYIMDVPLDDLPQGAYLLQARTRTGTSVTRIIVGE